MNLSFEISLADLGAAIEYRGDSDAERQEIMDFLVETDEGMADYEFSQELIFKLAENFAHEMDASFGQAKVGITMRGQAELVKTLPKLAEDLSHVEPDHLIGLVASAVHIAREREYLIELTHGGTVTDCVGGPCGCEEGVHE